MVKLMVYFCTCCIVFRKCARATQVVNLASAELCMYLDIY